MVRYLKENWLSALIVSLSALFIGAALFFLKDPLGQAVALSLAAAVFILPLLIKKPELGLGLVGFFLTFERFPTLDVGGNSLKINHILILVVLLVYLTVKLSRRELKIPRDPIRIFVVLFLFSLAFSLPYAINQSHAIQVYAFDILMGIVFLTVTLVAQTKDAIKIAVKGVLWGALAAGLFGLYQFFGDMVGLPNSVTLLKAGYDKSTFGFARVQAAAEEPLYFANFIFIPMMISLILLIKGKISEVFGKSYAVVLVIILLIDFILALSRGAFLGAGVVLLLVFIFQAKSIFQLKKILPALIILIFVIAGAYLALLKSEPQAIDLFIAQVTVQNRDTESVVLRLTTSEQAIQLFLDNKIHGVGPGNFGPVVQNNPTEKPADVGWMIVNDEYLEILAENGLIGFSAFVLLLIVIFWRSITAYRHAKDEFLKALLLGLIFAFIGILVQYATFSTLYIIHIWFLIGLIAAVSNLILEKNAE
jgi:O-antigen ligase